MLAGRLFSASMAIAQSSRGLLCPIASPSARLTDPLWLGPGDSPVAPCSLSLQEFYPLPRARVIEMPRQMSVLLYAVVLIVGVVSVDVLFFRNRFWERLIVNIGIVLVFAAFYLRFWSDR